MSVVVRRDNGLVPLIENRHFGDMKLTFRPNARRSKLIGLRFTATHLIRDGSDSARRMKVSEKSLELNLGAELLNYLRSKWGLKKAYLRGLTQREERSEGVDFFA